MYNFVNLIYFPVKVPFKETLLKAQTVLKGAGYLGLVEKKGERKSIYDDTFGVAISH